MKCLVCVDREPDRPAVCDPCRLWLPNVLRDIAEAYQLLPTTGDEAQSVGILIDDDGTFDGPITYHILAIPAGPARAANRGAHVTGSREAPIPVRVDLVDLTAPARVPNPVRGHSWYPRSLWPEDQTGHQPVATRLDQWVRDWRTYPSCPGDMLPDPTVRILANWLTVRLDWACDRHPAIDEFASEMRTIRSTLHTINEGRREQPELCDGVVCSGCDLRNTCYRHPGSQWRAECGVCGKLYTDDEWQRWTGLLAAQTQGVA